MKKLLALSFSLILVLLCSCSCSSKVKKIEDSFEKYQPMQNDAFVWNDKIFTKSLKIEHEGSIIGGFVSKDDGIYYLSSSRIGLMDHTVEICKYDFSSGTSELVFKKEHLANKPSLALYKDGKIHFQYNFTITGDPNGNVCEYYDVETGKSDACPSLETNTKKYTVQVLDSDFKVINSQSGESYLIDEDFLSSTEYSALNLEESFIPNKTVYSNGHYLLCYGTKIRNTYLFATFELLPKEQKIIFQSLHKIEKQIAIGTFPYDLFYIVKD